MHKTMTKLALASAFGLALCAQARADVIYTLTNTGGTSVLPVTVTLEVTDAAVESGSFTLSGGGAAQFYKGDLAGFVNFAASGLLTSTPSAAFNWNVFNLALTFDADGDITSDDVTWYGPYEGGTIGGDMALSSGTLSSDSPRCGSGVDGFGGICGTISGAWTRSSDAPDTSSPVPAPEPASLAVLAAGLLGLAIRRCLA